MKKYLISKVYLWVDIVVILFAVSGIVVSGMSFKNFLGWEDREVDVGLILIFVHILSWYMLVAIIIDLFKFPIGCYTLNKEGVTLYVGQKKYCHNWSDFQYITFYGMDAEQYGAHTFAYTYWICLSEKNVRNSISGNPFSKNNLLKYSRRNLDTIACFQYRKEIVPLLNEYLPEKLKPAFSWHADLIKDNMNWIEKIYNK